MVRTMVLEYHTWYGTYHMVPFFGTMVPLVRMAIHMYQGYHTNGMVHVYLPWYQWYQFGTMVHVYQLLVHVPMVHVYVPYHGTTGIMVHVVWQ